MKSNCPRYIFICVIFGALFLSASCKSVAKRLSADQDLVADTGELTRYELEKSAVRLARGIVEEFRKNPREAGVFIAFLPTKNETSESLPTGVFDDTLIQELRKNKIFTVSVKNRKEAIKEFEFNQTGLTDGALSIGRLKSPNFFVRCRIDENIFRHGGEKIVEQIIHVELTEIETLVVTWSNKVIYRKKAVSSSQVSW